MSMHLMLILLVVVGVTNARFIDSFEMTQDVLEPNVDTETGNPELLEADDVIIEDPEHTCCKKHVAFSAYLTSDRPCLGKKQHIKFDGVQLNDGKGYEPSTGVFRAPYSGVYSFTIAVGYRGKGEISVRLVQEGKLLVSAVAEGTFRWHDVQGSNTVIVHLCKGKPVWVEVDYGKKIRGATADVRPTTFSGSLLYQKA